MKNWEGKKFRVPSARKIFCSCPPLFQFAPTYWAHAIFLHSSWGHACCDHNESESYRPIIICRHCVDQQADSLVFTEFHLNHREWSHWKVGGQRPILAPLHQNLEGPSPSLPLQLVPPCLDSMLRVIVLNCWSNTLTTSIACCVIVWYQLPAW